MQTEQNVLTYRTGFATSEGEAKQGRTDSGHVELQTDQLLSKGKALDGCDHRLFCPQSLRFVFALLHTHIPRTVIVGPLFLSTAGILPAQKHECLSCNHSIHAQLLSFLKRPQMNVLCRVGTANNQSSHHSWNIVCKTHPSAKSLVHA